MGTRDRPSIDFLGATVGYSRNDAMADGAWARSAIARQAQHLLTRHGLIIPGKFLPALSGVRNSAADLRLWVTRFRSGPVSTTLVVDVSLQPTDTTAGSPGWYLKVDGVSYAIQRHNVRCGGGGGGRFDEIFEMRQEIPIIADTTHTLELWTDDNCRVVGWDMHEKPRESLEAGVDTGAVDFRYAVPHSPCFNTPLSDARAALTAAWQKMRGVHLSWNVDDPATPIAVSSTSATDLWGTGVGPTAPTQYRNSYANENLLRGIANVSIPTVVWAYGERTAGAGNVLARFIGDNHGGGVDVTINGTLGFYTSTSYTLKPQAAGDVIRVQYLVSAGGTTGNIYAVGCYPLVGT